MGCKTIFAVFEGIDSVGKTTLINLLRTKLEEYIEIKKKFNKFVFIREPGFKNEKIEKNIKELIFSPNFNLNHKSKALLFFTTRSEQIEKTIIPCIKNGSTLIICDRYFLSTLVYQCGMLNFDENWINETNNFITENIIPDLTFYLTISKKEHLKRLNDRKKNETHNSFDEIFKNYESLNSNYEKFILKYSNKLGKIIRLNGENPVDTLVNQVVQEIKNIEN